MPSQQLGDVDKGTANGATEQRKGHPEASERLFFKRRRRKEAPPSAVYPLLLPLHIFQCVVKNSRRVLKHQVSFSLCRCGELLGSTPASDCGPSTSTDLPGTPWLLLLLRPGKCWVSTSPRSLRTAWSCCRGPGLAKEQVVRDLDVLLHQLSRTPSCPLPSPRNEKWLQALRSEPDWQGFTCCVVQCEGHAALTVRVDVYACYGALSADNSRLCLEKGFFWFAFVVFNHLYKGTVGGGA